MVPDALLLSMHQHAHTEHTETADNLQAKVEKEHTHCPVEDLFQASFQGTQLASLLKPAKHDITYTALILDSRYKILYNLTHLRGPPVV